MTYTVLTEFVNEMAKKLDMNMHKQHWRLSSLGYLRKRLHDEVRELMNALDKEESPNRISSECADIANFAMMISDYYSDWYADITTAQLSEKNGLENLVKNQVDIPPEIAAIVDEHFEELLLNEKKVER